MRRWIMMLGGLIVWAAHFFTVYIAASLFPGSPAARWLAAAATLAALAANGAILWRLAGREEEDFDLWMRRLGAAAAAISIVSVIWQAVPALLA